MCVWVRVCQLLTVNLSTWSIVEIESWTKFTPCRLCHISLPFQLRFVTRCVVVSSSSGAFWRVRPPSLYFTCSMRKFLGEKLSLHSPRLVWFSQCRWHSSLASSYCLIFNLAHLNSIRFNALCGGPIWAFGHLPRLTMCVCVCECCQADWHAAAVPRIISLKFLIHLKLIKWHRLRWNKKNSKQ